MKQLIVELRRSRYGGYIKALATKENVPAEKSNVGTKVIEMGAGGFQKALKPIKVRVSQVKATSTDNNFQVLNVEETHENEENDLIVDKGRGGPFHPSWIESSVGMSDSSTVQESRRMCIDSLRSIILGWWASWKPR